ncbi:MAG: CBS domain-containing protein [Deltaproteobacteria bacterium]|nr:CBS domain-containing protein [Deltaproteobacteria bacterium]
MTKDVRVAHAEDDLATIAQGMWSGDCGCVPIVDEHHRPVAMITDRDICMAALTTGRPLGDIHANTAMSHALYSVRDTESLEKAEATMRAQRVRRLPVVDAKGLLVGLLSMGDLLRHAEVHARKPRERDDGLSPNSIAWTLAGISEPWASAH